MQFPESFQEPLQKEIPLVRPRLPSVDFDAALCVIDYVLSQPRAPTSSAGGLVMDGRIKD
jgi:hypothetical protein